MTLDTSILAPAFALAGWTLAVLLRVAFTRIAAVRRGAIGPDAFRFGETPAVPRQAALANRNYMNLLELPMLFHVGCVIACVTGTASAAVLGLAWLYVALRVAHSLVHLTYNDVLHRLVVFATSNAVLTALWVLVGIAVFGSRA